MSRLKSEIHVTGIRDWPAKRALMRALFDVLNDKALVQAVVEGWVPRGPMLMDTVEKCYDTFRRWDRSRPSGENSRKFWRQVIKEKKPNAGMAQLWSSSIAEFVDFFTDSPGIKDAVGELIVDSRASLDSDTRALLKHRFAYGPEQNVPGNAQTSLDEYYLRGHVRMTFEGPQTGIQNGHIQSTQFYNIPEAAIAWAALVDSENYRMYLDCLLSLKALVESEHWKSALGNGTYNAAVTLGGGGSPEKDWVITTGMVSSLQEPSGHLTYVLNDISPYMIQQSVRFLQRRVMKNQLERRVKIEYVWSDFLRLDMLFTRPACQSAVWAILGGTIGNVSEREFFRSINTPSRIGDLLIVGVDTIEKRSEEHFEERMNAEYRSKELDTLLLAPIHGTAVEANSEGPVVDVTVKAYEDGMPPEYSDVPNSRTAVFSIPSPTGEEAATVLAYSTRYVLESFLALTERFGWEHLVTTEAPSGSTFRQLLLRRVH